MRKVFLFMMVTVDGMFEGPNHDITWHTVDEEFNQFSHEHTASADLFLFGKTTYELMASYWPTDEAKQDDPIITDLMNKTPKIVFSTTLEKADWENTTLIKENAADRLREIKSQPGKDIAIFGSNNLTVRLMEEELVDEFRIMVSPIALGQGTRLFEGLKSKLNLKLVDTRKFGNGNMLLTYQPNTKNT